VITLVDGTKYVIAESLAELVLLIREYRASVVAEAQHLVSAPPAARLTEVQPVDDREPATNVVKLHRRER
jgi:flagellar protein FlbD